MHMQVSLKRRLYIVESELILTKAIVVKKKWFGDQMLLFLSKLFRFTINASMNINSIYVSSIIDCISNLVMLYKPS